MSRRGAGSLIEEPEATGHAEDVGVDREGGPSERERQYARGSLRSHAGERSEVVPNLRRWRAPHPGQVEGSTLTLTDLPEDGEQAGGLDVGEPSRPDGSRQVQRIRHRQGIPRGETLPHRGVSAVPVHVAGVLG